MDTNITNNSDTSSSKDLSLEEVIEGDIFELAGFGDGSAEDKAKILDQLVRVVRIRVLDRIDSELSEDQKEQLKTVLDSGTEAELKDFLDGLGMDFEVMTAKEAAKAKIEFLTYLKMIKKSGETLAELLVKIKNEDI